MSTRISTRTRSMLELSNLEVTLPELAEKGGWRGVFAAPEGEAALALTVELGIGKDPHLVEQASRHPDRYFVGLEHSKKKLEMVHAKAIRRRLSNIRLLRADIFRVLDKVFVDGSIEQCYMLFPDPWPKKRHAKNRMVQESLMKILTKKLRSGSEFELRTDHANYADQMIEVLTQTDGLHSALAGSPLLSSPSADRPHTPTLFESKFVERGLDLHYLYFCRDKAAAPSAESSLPWNKLATLDPLHGNRAEDGRLPRISIDAATGFNKE